MKNDREKNLKKDLDHLIPKRFTRWVKAEDIQKQGITYALPYVFEIWLQLVNEMKEGLNSWFKAVDKTDASKYHFDMWYRGVRSSTMEYCLTPKAESC